ncbi:hypothetical protein H6P81_006852 [Aristolochia fimbriata]|uniref:Uncharacterized protein n=1 Tax=Aristolochia fimbriata TaxID=158543 RepID=A0AAV7F307_ARIFI|nr:hypothetical protein H6P81_006852 [Aristolochia fimbriata]
MGNLILMHSLINNLPGTGFPPPRILARLGRRGVPEAGIGAEPNRETIIGLERSSSSRVAATRPCDPWKLNELSESSRPSTFHRRHQDRSTGPPTTPTATSAGGRVGSANSQCNRHGSRHAARAKSRTQSGAISRSDGARRGVIRKPELIAGQSAAELDATTAATGGGPPRVPRVDSSGVPTSKKTVREAGVAED